MTRHRPTVGIISLGCAKNLVDAEIMLGGILGAGMTLTADPAAADVLIVNTCGFIDAAKEESVAAILDALAIRTTRAARGRPRRKVLVGGCLAQRFAAELAAELPEVDAFFGLDQLHEIPALIGRLMAAPPRRRPARPPLNLVTPRPRYLPDYDTPRFRLTPPHFSYLKIAEGCNHPCSFCTIPQMRGRHRSRTIRSLVAEAERAVAAGVRELNLISQDTTFYGRDLRDRHDRHDRPAALAPPERRGHPAIPAPDGPTLADLLAALDSIPGDFWVRLLYTHPAHWDDALIRAIAGSKKIARYIDIPLQHIHPRILRAMRRETTAAHLFDLLARFRAGIPGVALRTTFIVGFPGETEAEFEGLLEFIARAQFERLGVFAYSREESTAAARLPGQLPAATKQRRRRQALALQQEIARATGQRLIGRTLKVLAEQPRRGRTEFDAPDIDGHVTLTSPVPPGQFVTATVTGTAIYDLTATPT